MNVVTNETVDVRYKYYKTARARRLVGWFWISLGPLTALVFFAALLESFFLDDGRPGLITTFLGSSYCIFLLAGLFLSLAVKAFFEEICPNCRSHFPELFHTEGNLHEIKFCPSCRQPTEKVFAKGYNKDLPHCLHCRKFLNVGRPFWTVRILYCPCCGALLDDVGYRFS